MAKRPVCLSLPVRWFVCLNPSCCVPVFACLSVCLFLPDSLCACLSRVSVCLSACQSLYFLLTLWMLSVCLSLSIWLSMCLSLPVCMFVCLCLSVCGACLCVCLSVCVMTFVPPHSLSWSPPDWSVGRSVSRSWLDGWAGWAGRRVHRTAPWDAGRLSDYTRPTGPAGQTYLDGCNNHTIERHYDIYQTVTWSIYCYWWVFFIEIAEVKDEVFFKVIFNDQYTYWTKLH